MDIGPEFDDDFFEKPKEKEESEPSNYEAKVCVPMWYMETQMAGRPNDEMLLTLKHQSDFYYFSQDYAKAAEAYERCLELVPPSNNTWKREFMENLARSLLHTGNAEKSLEWSLKLHACSFSADQKVVSMNLLATVCHKLGKYKEELEALHSCLASHKSCPEFWLRLGLCYAGLFKIDLPGYSVLKSVLNSETEPCCAFSLKLPCQHPTVQADVLRDSSAESAIPSNKISQSADTGSSSERSPDTTKCEMCTLGIYLVSSCLIQTRILIDSGGPNVLGMERDERIKEKIAASLKHMEIDQTFIDAVSETLGTNFITGLQEACDSSLDHRAAFPKIINSNVEKKDA